MSKYRKSARGQECQVRSAVCNYDPETTVLAHIPGGGMGTKTPDTEGAFACSACHDFLDKRDGNDCEPDFIRLLHLAGAVRTRAIWRAKGWID